MKGASSKPKLSVDDDHGDNGGPAALVCDILVAASFWHANVNLNEGDGAVSNTAVRRNVFILALCQGLAMTDMSITITVTALNGEALLTDKQWATVPLCLQALATMLTTIPASALIGLNDFLIFGTVAASTFASGTLHGAFGWTAVNYGVLPLVAMTLAATL